MNNAILRLILSVSLCSAQLACVAVFSMLQSDVYASDGNRKTSRFEYVRPIMGTELKVILYAHDESHAAFAINAILEDLDQRAKPINNYLPSSEVSRLATLETGKRHRLSRELYEVLSESKRWYDLTDHTFDVTAGATIELWRKARKQKTLPSDEEVVIAQKSSGWDHLILESNSDLGNTISIQAKELQINVSGIATGYLIDHAIMVLQNQGIESALIDIGGDIIVSNPPPDSDGWKIDLAGLRETDPVQNRVVLKNQAVTTSGDLNQFLEIDGVRYSHIIDPTTGRPIPRRVSATIVAKRAIDADAAATAIAVLGIRRAKPLLENMPIDSVMILEQDFQDLDLSGSGIKRFEWSRDFE